MVHVAVPRRPGHEFDPWTFSDLHDLPDDGWRYEIVDGSLTMTPPPGVRHEFVSAQLLLILSRAVPGSHTVLGPVGLDLHPSYRTPDLCVIPRKVVRDDGELVTPADVLLAIEVVSPGSVTTDRVTKPAQYAKAGIPAYWRVETRPQVSLTGLPHDRLTLRVRPRGLGCWQRRRSRTRSGSCGRGGVGACGGGRCVRSSG